MRVSATAVLFCVLLVPLPAQASFQTAEGKCQKARMDASAKYLACHQKTLGKIYATSYFPDFQASFNRCRAAYQAAWTKLQANPAYAGTPCAQPRFVDNGDGTVTDNLTSLVWEQKVDDGGVHDPDDGYSFSTGAPWLEDGTVFTSFLPALNDAAFGGSRGWRLPTLAELATIVLAPYPCGSGPCIDPIFGPVKTSWYSTASGTPSSPATSVDDQWLVGFNSGEVTYFPGKNGNVSVRAVRGGW